MKTPICDFVRKYKDNGDLRLHMPGHKGEGALGIEALDITEIDGADSLYQASGIIKQSEENASLLFGAKTFYSVEGSSQCIRAMMFLCSLAANRKPKILAGRNAHKAFLTAAAMLDLEAEWLYPAEGSSYLSCKITAEELERLFSSSKELPTALYLTSPDYLGNMVDVKSIADVCHKYGVLLAIDNAHGAYLKFLPESLHPIDLGADICCDSAHKTLPVLTGGAYLHVSPSVPSYIAENAKKALEFFGSTSPSYLILESLDQANAYLEESFKNQLKSFIPRLAEFKSRLEEKGYSFIGNEPMKLTVDAKKYGYTGDELANILAKSRVSVEFHDPDYLVMMPSVNTDIETLEKVLLAIPKRDSVLQASPKFIKPEAVLSIREAMLGQSELISIKEAEGKVLACATVGCPPAVPIAVCGERLTKDIIECFKYYGIRECWVIK